MNRRSLGAAKFQDRTWGIVTPLVSWGRVRPLLGWLAGREGRSVRTRRKTTRERKWEMSEDREKKSKALREGMSVRTRERYQEKEKRVERR